MAMITRFNKSGLNGYDYVVQQVWPRQLRLRSSTSLVSMAMIMQFNKSGLNGYDYMVMRGSMIQCSTVSTTGNRYDFDASDNKQKGSGEWW